MFSLKDLKCFLKKLGFVWNYEYIFLGNKVIAIKPEDIISNYLTKTIIVYEDGKDSELRISVNNYKFVLYIKQKNKFFLNEKEINVSREWQGFIKSKRLVDKECEK